MSEPQSSTPRHGAPGMPRIFDRTLLRHRRTRAARAHKVDNFLVHDVSADLIERLSMVKRKFDAGLVLGCHDDGFRARDLLAQKTVSWLVSSDTSDLIAANADRPALVADEEYLPFAPGTFDLIVSPLCLHWTNDLPGALIQIRQTLKPDGLFLGALMGSATLQELRGAFIAAEVEIMGGVTPRVAPFADLRAMGDLMQRAGFALPVADRDVLSVTYASPMAVMADLRAMGWTNVLSDRSRKPLTRAVLARAIDHYQENFADGDGRVRATFEIIHLCGWGPHQSQQKPLAPGSAKIRLADALGVEEGSLGKLSGNVPPGKAG